MGDAKFPEVKVWKKPLLLKASKRLCTHECFQFLRVEIHKVRTIPVVFVTGGPAQPCWLTLHCL